MFNPESLTLLAITDNLRDGRDGLISRAIAAARGGATMIQLRLKDEDAHSQVEVARALVAALPPQVSLIVNDRADVALAAGAAGVHLGADDLPVAAVRRITPPEFVIGASVGCNDEVPAARGADYVGIGPVYPTGSKADAGTAIGVEEFARLAALCSLPAVAIGGINAANVRAVIAAGARGAAVISAIFGAPDPEAAARAMRDAMAN
ncbi:MAG TPA: thiamine phosphate synthase [Gemmatimonadaceae bacterium]